MFLHIMDHLTVGEVEDRFNKCFPHLELAFYSRPHNVYEASDMQSRIAPETRIGDLQKQGPDRSYEIKSWYTIAQVEQEMAHQFGLYVQVFRRNRFGHMVQTTLTDDLTLGEREERA